MFWFYLGLVSIGGDRRYFFFLINWLKCGNVGLRSFIVGFLDEDVVGLL